MSIYHKEAKALKKNIQFLSRNLDEPIIDTSDLLSKVEGLKKYYEKDTVYWKQITPYNFPKFFNNMSEEEVKTLISEANRKIKYRLYLDSIEDKYFEEFINFIEEDSFFKNYQITVLDFEVRSTNFICMTVSMLTGNYELTGSLNKIKIKLKLVIKDIAKEIGFDFKHLKTHCPSCNSLEIEFVDYFSICHDCACLFSLINKKIYEEYDINDEDWHDYAYGAIEVFTEEDILESKEYYKKLEPLLLKSFGQNTDGILTFSSNKKYDVTRIDDQLNFGINKQQDEDFKNHQIRYLLSKPNGIVLRIFTNQIVNKFPVKEIYEFFVNNGEISNVPSKDLMNSFSYDSETNKPLEHEENVVYCDLDGNKIPWIDFK